MKKLVAMMLALTLTATAFTGCGSAKDKADERKESSQVGTKSFVFGDTTFNSENEEFINSSLRQTSISIILDTAPLDTDTSLSAYITSFCLLSSVNIISQSSQV